MLMKARKLDIIGLCETRLTGQGTNLLHDNYHLIYSGGGEAKHGVGVILTEELAQKIEYLVYKNERISSFPFALGTRTIRFIQAYAPQLGRPHEEKEEFYENLQEVKNSVPNSNNIIILGNVNGHVGNKRLGMNNIIGAFGIGNINREVENLKKDFLCKYKQAIDTDKDDREDIGNINDNWLYFKNATIGTATDIVLCKTTYGRRRKQKAWWTKELQLAVKEKMKRFRKWIKIHPAEDRENYNRARQEVERVNRIAKQESFEQIGNYLENEFDGTKTLIYPSGEDGIPTELLKNLGDAGTFWFLEVCIGFRNGGRNPDDLGLDIICLIYRKGVKTNCSNYRAISLMPYALKVYERMMESRLKKCVQQKLDERQCGFRPNRGTNDLIFTLKIISEETRE
ncbi:uncharacterized protein [Palaemon carinicauda]|uniref:uncharacterized protein n=1 Tax=Palaemon carinicauda TaxID=392227 RepID=UPI0035B62379